MRRAQAQRAMGAILSVAAFTIAYAAHSQSDPAVPLKGNFVQNPSFEAGSGTAPSYWTLSQGATTRIFKDDGVQPFDGNRYLRLGNVGAQAHQIAKLSAASSPNRSFVLTVRSRLQTETRTASGMIRLDWLPENGAVPVDSLPIKLTPREKWEDFSYLLTPPAGVKRFAITVSCTGTADPNNGLLVDALQVSEGASDTAAVASPLTSTLPLLGSGGAADSVAPAIVAPADHAVFRAADLPKAAFSWSPVPKATCYGIQIICLKLEKDDPDNKIRLLSVMTDGPITSTNLPLDDFKPGIYQCSVVAFNGSTPLGQFSKGRVFEIR